MVLRHRGYTRRPRRKYRGTPPRALAGALDRSSSDCCDRRPSSLSGTESPRNGEGVRTDSLPGSSASCPNGDRPFGDRRRHGRYFTSALASSAFSKPGHPASRFRCRHDLARRCGCAQRPRCRSGGITGCDSARVGPIQLAAWPLGLAAAVTSAIAPATGTRRRRMAILGMIVGSITVWRWQHSISLSSSWAAVTSRERRVHSATVQCKSQHGAMPEA